MFIIQADEVNRCSVMVLTHKGYTTEVERQWIAPADHQQEGVEHVEKVGAGLVDGAHDGAARLGHRLDGVQYGVGGH